MPKTPREYRRLSGRGMGTQGNRFFAVTRSYCSIWLGKDHLLLVEQVGFTESYKRFYFRDIQAIIIRKTAAAAITSAVLGIIALGLLAWALAVNGGGRIALLILCGAFAVLTLLNVWPGSSCVTHIKTSVQTERVAAWNHLRAARKAMARIHPLILEAQGAFFPDEIKAELERRLGGFAESPPTEFQ